METVYTKHREILERNTC